MPRNLADDIHFQLIGEYPSIGDVGIRHPELLREDEYRELCVARLYARSYARSYENGFWTYNFTLLCFFLAEIGEL